MSDRRPPRQSRSDGGTLRRSGSGRSGSGRSGGGAGGGDRSGRSSGGRSSGGGRPGGAGGRSNDGRRGNSGSGGSGRSGAGRNSGGGRSGDGRSGGKNPRRDDGRRSGSGSRRDGSRGDRFSPKWREDADARAERGPQTAAERRKAEVDARRDGPKPQRTADPRELRGDDTEQWIDEGSVRDAALGAAARASTPARPRREPKPLDPAIGDELVDALGAQRGKRLSERLAQASEALDRERFDEARRISASIAKEAPAVAAVQEVLGLASYRLGRYKQAVAALQKAQELHPDPAMLPVIADGYRAMRRWQAVERTWDEIKAASPSHDVMAEGRIVWASSLADQGDLKAAIDAMEEAPTRPKRVRPHHLRQWYVLGDLHDRMGDTINARRYFATVADHDPEFVEVLDRLRALGR